MTLAPISRRALIAAAAILGPVLRSASAAPVDPIFAAIATAKRADLAHAAALAGLDENDEAAVRVANALSDASSAAAGALAETQPTTLAGLHALIRHYADDAALNDPQSVGACHLERLAAVIEPCPPV